jgi:hypothetical protein
MTLPERFSVVPAQAGIQGLLRQQVNANEIRSRSRNPKSGEELPGRVGRMLYSPAFDRPREIHYTRTHGRGSAVR